MTEELLKSGATWYYAGIPYRVRFVFDMWCIEGGEPPFACAYGVVLWFGDSMLEVEVINFGVTSRMYLEYADMQTLN